MNQENATPESNDPVLLERSDGIAWITLNRPAKRNAISPPLVYRMVEVLAELEADGKLHLSLVYRGTPANSAKFIEAQDKVIAALYPTEPVQNDTPKSESQGSEENTVSEAPAESEVQ